MGLPHRARDTSRIQERRYDSGRGVGDFREADGDGRRSGSARRRRGGTGGSHTRVREEPQRLLDEARLSGAVDDRHVEVKDACARRGRRAFAPLVQPRVEIGIGRTEYRADGDTLAMSAGARTIGGPCETRRRRDEHERSHRIRFAERERHGGRRRASAPVHEVRTGTAALAAHVSNPCDERLGGVRRDVRRENQQRLTGARVAKRLTRRPPVDGVVDRHEQRALRSRRPATREPHTVGGRIVSAPASVSYIATVRSGAPI